MTTQTKHRRGTTAQIAAMTPAEAEIVVDTTKKTAVVGDGSTAGGIPLARAAGGTFDGVIGGNTPAAITGTTGTFTGAGRVDGGFSLGVAPSAWSGHEAMDFGTSGGLSSDGNGVFLGKNAYDSNGAGAWIYKQTATASLYLQQAGGSHVWYTAPSGTAGNAITFTERVNLSSSDLNIGVNTIIGSTSVAPAARVDAYNATATTTTIVATVTSDVGGTHTTNMDVAADGDVRNTNNSYGAISDVKIKTNIEEAQNGQIADLVAIARLTKKYNLKSDPDGFKHLGWVAQEVREISPGLIKESPDMEKVEVEKTRTVERQVTNTETREVEKSEIVLENGKAIRKAWKESETVHVPQFDEFPVFSEGGIPVVDEDGKQIIHQVPIMETVEEAYTETEDRQIILEDGAPSVTLSIKHSILYAKMVKAFGELVDAISKAESLDDLKSKIG